MEVFLVDNPISKPRLKDIAREQFGELVKAVVDIRKGVMAIGGELHSDEEAFLLESGSRQQDLWGINLYPDLELPEMLEFDSLINIRPSQNNRSRGVEDSAVRDEILRVVCQLVQ